jgi:hypothetical protein
MKITRPLLLLTLISFLVGCNGKPTVRQALNLPGLDAPQAWIDAPLPDMHIPFAQYEFVAHGSDQAGISQLEWILDGSTLSIMDSKNSKGKLVTFKTIWIPPAPGVYTLQVKAKNNAGVWSSLDEATFTVGDITPTPTTIQSDTPTPVITDTPTPVISYTPTQTATKTPTETKTPTPVPSELSYIPGLSTNQFFFGNCQPNQVDVSVQLSNTNSVKHVELFVRLLDNSSSDSTAWDSYGVMSDTGNGLFRIALKSSNIFGANKFSSAVVLYQFIVVGEKGKVIGRSPSYNDLALSFCRGIIVIPPGGPTLVPPGGPTDVPTLIPPPR